MLFDTGIATVGVYPEVRYNLGEHAFGDRGDSPLRGFSLELGANINQRSGFESCGSSAEDWRWCHDGCSAR
jgi:hypothetical protein